MLITVIVIGIVFLMVAFTAMFLNSSFLTVCAAGLGILLLLAPSFYQCWADVEKYGLLKGVWRTIWPRARMKDPINLNHSGGIWGGPFRS